MRTKGKLLFDHLCFNGIHIGQLQPVLKCKMDRNYTTKITDLSALLSMTNEIQMHKMNPRYKVHIK